MIDFLLGILSAGFGDNSLDTRRIDRNIEMLKNHTWFKDIYEDENYHRLFFVNRNVRRYLQSTMRVKRIIKRAKSQRVFLVYLDKQLKK
ncbi:hypothetical protein J7J00_25935 [Bacillus sp. ISL-4]|uniref:hypothetical protein n=1 Tax=Bacillus sp. ISL-4 TaxID=2819125 RepID=UPI001BEC9E53|nr:hypothetical protein [Bacillus sp. ISL-4]MBT2668843.1 hypothetical protein [Bacillus sp. ISL-4]MBT2673312.1 hypothetical protein [Streptomyces sp. ISL-14]